MSSPKNQVLALELAADAVQGNGGQVPARAPYAVTAQAPVAHHDIAEAALGPVGRGRSRLHHARGGQVALAQAGQGDGDRRRLGGREAEGRHERGRPQRVGKEQLQEDVVVGGAPHHVGPVGKLVGIPIGDPGQAGPDPARLGEAGQPVAGVAAVADEQGAPVLMVLGGIQIVRRVAEYAIAKPTREMLFTVLSLAEARLSCSKNSLGSTLFICACANISSNCFGE